MIDQAEQMLDSIPVSGRSAEWHYLEGMGAYRRGWSEQAFSYFTTACNMNPSNTEYRAALNNMQSQRAYNYGGFNQPNMQGDTGCAVCDICSAIMCTDCLCSCCRSGC